MSFGPITPPVVPSGDGSDSGMGVVPLRTEVVSGWRSMLRAGSLLPERLSAALDQRRVAVLVGRNSGQGSKARELAAKDLAGVVSDLAAASGLDFGRLLPSEAELVEALEAARSSHSKGRTGQKITHRFVVIDHAAEFGVVFVLAVGSGSKLTDDFEQPFVERVNREYHRARGVLLAMKRHDRGNRSGLGAARQWMMVKETDGWLFDEEGLRLFDDTQALVAHVKGLAAEQQAKQMPSQTRREQQNRSGTEMLGGRAAYHGGPPLPPGFGACWLAGSGVTPDSRMIYLDGEPWRPEDEAVAYGLSLVRDEDGSYVDQVANVRFVLSRLGDPAWPHKRIVAEMIARQVSTPHLRGLRHDAGATVCSTPTADEVIDTIVRNLHVYETGVLVRRLGSGFAVTIAGCFPGGPWATTADFDRIRRWNRNNRDKQNRASSLAMVGVVGRLESVQVRLLKDKRHPGRYVVVRECDYPDRVLVARPGVRVEAKVLAESVVEGLVAAGSQALRPLLPSELGVDHSSEVSVLRADRTLAARRLEELCARKRQLNGQISEKGPNGVGVVTGALLAELNEEYNLLAEREIPLAQGRVEALDADIEDLRDARPDVVDADVVLHVVASLREVDDVTYRLLWQRVIQNLEFRVDRLPTGEDRISWTGFLRLGDDEHTVLVPFRGEQQLPQRRKPGPKPHSAEAWLAALADGQPMGSIRLRGRQQNRPLLAQLLGVTDTHHVFSCEDPRVLRATCAVLLGGDETDEIIAARLGEPKAFVEQIRSVLGDNHRSRWRIRERRLHSALHVLAAGGDSVAAAAAVELGGRSSLGNVYNVAKELRAVDSRWSTERKRGYRFECSCGSHAAVMLAIPEPVGAVCLGCRCDAAGLVWPADPYDRYVAHPEIWAAHGYEFETD